MCQPISVVIPYSPEHTPVQMLEEAKQSVLDQSIETKIYIIKDTEQRGPGWARNKGLSAADTKFVAFLDADDLWKAEKLERQLEKMKETGAGICLEGKLDSKSTDRFIRDVLAGSISSVTSSIVIDTDKVDATFEEQISRREDHLFILEAASQAGVCFCPDLTVIRKHEQGLSTRDTKEINNAESDLFISLVCKRVDGAEQHLDLYYAELHHRKGRNAYLDGDYSNATRDFIKSLWLQPRLKTFGALTLNISKQSYQKLYTYIATFYFY